MKKKSNIKKAIYLTLFIFGALICILGLSLFILLGSYKEEIAARLIKQTENNYGIKVRYKKIKISLVNDQSLLSLSFKDVEVINLNQNRRSIPFFNAGTVDLSLDLKRLLKRQYSVNEISIKDAKIILLKDKSGRCNYDFKSAVAGKIAEDPVLFKIKKVNLKNVDFDFFNRQKNKHIGIEFNRNTLELKNYNANLVASLNGSLRVKELLFKPARGPMLYNKQAHTNIDMVYFGNEKRLLFSKSSWALIEDQKYLLSGILYMDSLKLSLNIRSHVKDFKKTISLLSRSIQNKLSTIHVSNALNAEANIVTKLNKEEDPELIVKFWGRNNKVTLGDTKVPYTNLSYSGELLCVAGSNGIPDMENATIVIKNIKGKMYNFPFTANISFKDLVRPYLKVEGTLKVDSRKIKFKPGKDFDLDGFCYAVIKYEGFTSELNKKSFLKDKMKLVAEISMDHLTYKTKKNKLPFTLHGKAFVTNDQFKFNKLLLTTTGGNFVLRGKGEGLTSYVCDLGNGFKADVTASTFFFDINPLLKGAGKKVSRDELKTVSKVEKNDFEINLELRAKKMLISKLKAEDASASINYANDVINLKKLNFNSCGGSLYASGFLYGFLKATANIEVQNMDVNSLFKQCGDFNQKAILSENVSGIVSATAVVTSDFDGEFMINPKTLNAKIKARVNDGHLIHYQPLEKIANYIFVRRNFNDVSFTEINPDFEIKGNELKIKELEIASNVLNFFVSGTYNFKDQSNLNLVVPWSNLKARGKNYKARKLANEGEVGKGLKLNLYGFPHKLKVRLGHR